MKRNRIQNRCIATCLTLIAMLLTSVGVNAQNVTIKATNGSMIASVPEGETDYDTFYKCNGFATWQHEQLSMAFTASDATDLTSSGQLDNPANNLFSDGTHIQIGKGYNNYPICYLSVSLPKGYRFTGYTIKFSKLGQTSKRYQTGTNWLGNPTYDNVDFNTYNTSSTFGETGSDFATYKTSADAERGGDAQIISRTSQVEGDMDNVLYFKLYNKSNNTDDRALIVLESAEFFFTAEADYTPLTVPGSAYNVSAIDIPFTTSKVDYGTITSRTYNGATRVSYSSANVKDLTANFTLYEADSYKEDADFDGVPGRIVDYKDGSISVEGEYYRIGAADASNPGTEEHIYYIETPSYVLLSDGTTKNPVGYRIVGAQIDYKYGPTNTYGEQPVTIDHYYDRFYIFHNSGNWNSSTYYLTSSGGTSTSSADRALWFQDDEGYIRLCNGESPTNIYLTNNGNTPTTTNNKAEAKVFTINNYGIYYNDGSNHYLHRAQNATTITFTTNSNRRASSTTYGRVNVPSYSTVTAITGTASGAYTLKVYDKTGTSAEDNTVTVNESNKEGSITLSGLNNDAIKIGVVGTGLIQGSLTLQALDPYLNSMDVVCQDNEDDLDVRLTQTFTASDFSVNGGEFYFFLPADLATKNVKITFENLKSKYFDESYTGGSSNHNSRINFVKSAHYNTFNTNATAPIINKIYNNRSEATNASNDRLSVGIVGTQPFKFNNADDLSTHSGILTEYPFSLENYAAAPNNGTFAGMAFTVSEQDQSLTRYVFTTDETRYNIAPTTAVQHRAYAYYKMIVHVMTATYTPQVAFTKIYNSSYCVDNEGKTQVYPFYGITVTATDGEGKPGFASLGAIYDKITNILNKTKVDDNGNNDLPTSLKQVLFVDLSQLAGIYIMTDDTHHSIADYVAGHADNCLTFLPKGASSSSNNMAYKMESGTFHSTNNIIITDKQPFYSPYDISVDAANYAKYERKKSKSNYADTEYATVIMPFTISVDEATGEHKQTTAEGYDANYGTIKVLQMNKTNAIANADNNDNYGTLFFSKLDANTAANTPYAINIVDRGNNESTFTLIQSGSDIKATPASAKSGLFSATEITSNGQLDGTPYTFSHKGLFNGAQINKTKLVFYFANNGFYSSTALSSRYTTVDVFPFRSIYVPSTTTSLAKISFFNIFEGENPNFGGIATGIKDINSKMSSILLGKGTITIKADADNTYRIVTAGGQVMKNVELSAGESITINVPAGVYLVNGTKVFVQ